MNSEVKTLLNDDNTERERGKRNKEAGKSGFSALSYK